MKVMMEVSQAELEAELEAARQRRAAIEEQLTIESERKTALERQIAELAGERESLMNHVATLELERKQAEAAAENEKEALEAVSCPRLHRIRVGPQDSSPATPPWEELSAESATMERPLTSPLSQFPCAP